MSNKGADILVKTLRNIKSGNYKAIPQNHEEATYAKKIEKSEFLLDFNHDVNDIYNKIRALNGCGSAYFIMNNERVKIHEAELLREKVGQDFHISKSDFIINCQNGAIRPIILQKSGKKKVTLKEFLTQIH